MKAGLFVTNATGLGRLHAFPSRAFDKVYGAGRVWRLGKGGAGGESPIFWAFSALVKNTQDLNFSMNHTVRGDEREPGQNQLPHIGLLGRPAQSCKGFQLFQRLKNLSDYIIGGRRAQA